MKVLVVGGGGREHALAWKLAQSPKVQVVFVAPGNGGTAVDPRLTNLAITEFEALAEFAQAERIALTVVGPEGPLAAGLVDLFRARGLRVFGPSRAAAQLESSKAYAKAFMQRHNIPTAAFETFEVQEFAGMAAAPLDVATGTSNTSTAPSSGSVTSTATGELAVGFIAGHGNAQAISVTSPGYTTQAQQTTTGTIATVETGYKVLGAPGAQSFTGSFGTAMYWAAGIAVFKP